MAKCHLEENEQGGESKQIRRDKDCSLEVHSKENDASAVKKINRAEENKEINYCCKKIADKKKWFL